MLERKLPYGEPANQAGAALTDKKLLILPPQQIFSEHILLASYHTQIQDSGFVNLPQITNATSNSFARQKWFWCWRTG